MIKLNFFFKFIYFGSGSYFIGFRLQYSFFFRIKVFLIFGKVKHFLFYFYSCLYYAEGLIHASVLPLSGNAVVQIVYKTRSNKPLTETRHFDILRY